MAGLSGNSSRVAKLLACMFAFAVVILTVGMVGGQVINWIFPAFGAGLSTVLALITISIMIQFLMVVLQVGMIDAAWLAAVPDEEANEDDRQQDVMSDEQVEYMADQLSEAVVAKLLHTGSRGRPAPKTLHRAKR